MNITFRDPDRSRRGRTVVAGQAPCGFRAAASMAGAATFPFMLFTCDLRLVRVVRACGAHWAACVLTVPIRQAAALTATVLFDFFGLI